MLHTVYIYIHTHTYVYTYKHNIYIYIYICIHVCEYTCVYIYIYTHIHIYIYIYTCLYIYIYIHIHTYLHTYTHTYIHTHIHDFPLINKHPQPKTWVLLLGLGGCPASRKQHCKQGRGPTTSTARPTYIYIYIYIYTYNHYSLALSILLYAYMETVQSQWGKGRFLLLTSTCLSSLQREHGMCNALSLPRALSLPVGQLFAPCSHDQGRQIAHQKSTPQK